MKKLDEKIKEYTFSGVYPFHMPGHKRNFSALLNPYKYDITEIDGFDDLHCPAGILKKSMESAALFYKADKTYYLVNGSTCGLLSAIFAITLPNDKIHISRNCHKSVYNALTLRQLEPVYVYPPVNEDFRFSGGISADEVREKLIQEPEIKAVVIVSPTYEGVVSDIGKIADIAHEHNIPLIVDEAHGAHFSIAEGFPVSAIKLGADIVVQSLHKTLPSLTQTAVLHLKSSLVDRERLEKHLSVFQTTSPSYLFLSSIENCIAFVKENTEKFIAYKKHLDSFYKEALSFKNIKIADKSNVNKNHVFDFDIGKIVIRDKNLSGKELADKLRNDFKLELEMALPYYCVAMTSVCDKKIGFDRLYKALSEIDKSDRTDSAYKDNPIIINAKNKIVLKPGEAFEREKEEVDSAHAEGRISAENVYLYPPGIPIIVRGEEINQNAVSQIKQAINCGFHVHGIPKSKELKFFSIK